MKKHTLKIFVTITFLCSILSCQNEQNIQDLEPISFIDKLTYNQTKTIRTDGKYLDFKSFDEFETIRDYQFILNSENQALTQTLKHPKEIANELNFYSLGHLFEELIDSQKEHLEKISNKINTDESLSLDLTDEKVMFSERVLAHKNIVNLDINTGKISLKLFDQDMAYLLNENGIVLVQGAFYQYSDRFVKVSPYTHDFDMNLFLKANESNPETQLFFNKVIIESSQDLNKGSNSCKGDLPNTPLYVSGLINHIKITEQVPNCGTGPECWETGQIECCFEPITVFRSRLYMENTSYTECPFTVIAFCVGSDKRIAITNLGISGSYSYTLNGKTTSNSFNIISNNVSKQTYNIYTGDRLSAVNASATFVGNNTIAITSAFGNILTSTSTGKCTTSLND